ncbi:MAG TPA: hypothetical protein VGG94_02455 [Chthoniobacterales bacterium]
MDYKLYKKMTLQVQAMGFRNFANAVVLVENHAQGLQMAHNALQKSLLCGLPWSSEDFYSAMAVYRKAVGIEFGNADDALLDRWLDGADAAWKKEVKSKGDKVNLAEALEKAIEGGIKAIGLRLTAGTSRKLRTSRGSRGSGMGSRAEGEPRLKLCPPRRHSG